MEYIYNFRYINYEVGVLNVQMFNKILVCDYTDQEFGLKNHTDKIVQIIIGVRIMFKHIFKFVNKYKLMKILLHQIVIYFLMIVFQNYIIQI